MKKLENKNQMVINVSQEELLYILRTLGAPAIPGIDPQIFLDITEKEIAVAVGVAGRALIARGFINLNDKGEQIVTEAPLALIGTCALPRFSVLAEETTADTAQGIFWHGTNSLIIEHNIPMRGIHKFRALSTEVDLTDQILNSIQLPTKKPLSLPEGKIKKDHFEKGKSLIRNEGDKKQAIIEFITGGLKEKAATQLADIIDSAISTVTMGFLRHDRENNQGEVTGGIVVTAPKGSILVIPTTNGTAGVLAIQPLDPGSWKQWVAENIQNIQELEE